MALLDRVLDASIFFSFDRSGYERHARQFAKNAELDLSGRLCLVTGANSGIGYQTARGLLGRGAAVWLLCRHEGRGREALAQLRRDAPDSELALHILDMSELASIRRFAATVERPVFRLVHNAGVLPSSRQKTADGLELSLATNLIGPFLLTALLLPQLKAAPAARVVFVASGGLYSARLDQNALRVPAEPYDGVKAYAQAKRGMLILAQRWSEQLAVSGARCDSMHPGWVDTRAVRSSLPRFWRVMRNRLRVPEEGADTVVWLCASASLPAPPGSFWFDRRAQPAHLFPWTRETAEERAELWRMCCELSGWRAP